MKKILLILLTLIGIVSCAKNFLKEAQIAYSNGNYQKVVESANEGMKRKENKELLSLRGLAYFEMGAFEQASADLNKVVATGSGSLEVLEKSVLVNIYLNRNELAVLGYKELIKGYPKNETYYYHRAEAYTNLEEYDKALKDLDEALKIDSVYLQAINQKGVVCQKLGDFKTAIICFTNAINLFDNKAELYYNRSVSLFIIDKNSDALADIDKAINLDPNNNLYIYSRAAILKDLGRKDSCCQDLDKAISLGFKDFDSDLLDYCNINPLVIH